MRTSEQLKGYLRNLAKEKNISAQELLQIFMFERLIERLSLSEYRNHIVLKGGLLVASLIGIDERTTMDMDTTIVGYPVTEESMETLIEDIIKVELDDGIQFEFLGLNPIRKNDDYSNYTIKLEATYQEIRVPLKIDVTTGDAITPREIAYDYYLSFEGRTVSIYSYPIETVLAEKLETILSRNVTNTRARDFYDIYLLYNTQWEKVDISDLKEALIATGTNRDSLDEIDAYSEIMEDISTSRTIITSWERYQSENAYAREIELKNILIVISNILELLNLDDK
ncbi:nucleotidyl transferase AbiEii/AbiGii toxin family protein [Erysipelothrix amsterdamensis]|uniref:Nucleotidyl transferase AbiEii/AbiGii toxin family protein n=2 Tax=Erysipelotrichaceae TaxID=128827 RepID=A0AAU9VIU1_9FIRM|nr:nucleotidyl transferase AbiEii/AbiGii toxin family protein [Erysipelothrix rhusiopathiae]CAH2763334.1 nucleotidyl transferase AbiEii/AbiGii toxin family protein [Erysipelothrix sp. A18Y020d]MDE8032236.1 nucleotidyl transferase AbiEii/AbiGii toxin family protein [Erysipelothrix rhusiopathiae]MDE8036101.1 nucleotidyl transferase AbiEii/AbiGii toxin family protein [Erysipelothrix rhusiopathiae]MDE8090950.1 nucleotidyl transferase AbiEii/AbiGii toxin family protein [Erysipelothrix rhusiopathiae]